MVVSVSFEVASTLNLVSEPTVSCCLTVSRQSSSLVSLNVLSALEPAVVKARKATIRPGALRLVKIAAGGN